MSDLALLVAMAAAFGMVPGPPTPERVPQPTRRGDGHDDERLARAEAKRARKAARRREVSGGE